MPEQERQSTTQAASSAQPPPLPVAVARASRKTRIGEVVSDRMNKTIVVRTITRVPHAKFGKIVKQIRKFYVHDEENKAKTGDTVAAHAEEGADAFAKRNGISRARLVAQGLEMVLGAAA